MAIHSFSTKERTRPEDELMIAEIKQYCQETGQNFSHLLLANLRESPLYERAREHASSRNGSTKE